MIDLDNSGMIKCWISLQVWRRCSVSPGTMVTSAFAIQLMAQIYF